MKFVFSVTLFLFSSTILMAQDSWPVEFSEKRGLIEASFYLELSTKTGYEIYYTKNDGKTPGHGSLRYTKPIKINQTTVIRAIALKDGIKTIHPDEPYKKGFYRIPPEHVITKSFIFPRYVFNSKIYDVKIPKEAEFKGDDDYKDENYGEWLPIYNSDEPGVPKTIGDNFKSFSDKSFSHLGITKESLIESFYKLPVVSISIDKLVRDDHFGSFEIFDYTDGQNLSKQANCDIQNYGHSSPLYFSKFNMRFQFKSEYGEENKNLKFNIHKKVSHRFEPANEFKTLLARSASHDSIFHWSNDLQPSYIRNRLVYNLLGTLGQPVVHGRYAHLFLNGTYWGVYNLLERPDENWAQSYFGIDKENKLEQNYDYQKQTIAENDELIEKSLVELRSFIISEANKNLEFSSVIKLKDYLVSYESFVEHFSEFENFSNSLGSIAINKEFKEHLDFLKKRLDVKDGLINRLEIVKEDYAELADFDYLISLADDFESIIENLQLYTDLKNQLNSLGGAGVIASWGVSSRISYIEKTRDKLISLYSLLSSMSTRLESVNTFNELLNLASDVRSVHTNKEEFNRLEKYLKSNDFMNYQTMVNEVDSFYELYSRLDSLKKLKANYTVVKNCSNSRDITGQCEQGYEALDGELHDFLKILEIEDLKNEVSEKVNFESVIDTSLVHAFIGKGDWSPKWNVAAVLPRNSKLGLFREVSWDNDFSMMTLSHMALIQDSILGKLQSKIHENNLVYRQKFIDRAYNVLRPGGALDAENTYKVFLKLIKEIEVALPLEYMRWWIPSNTRINARGYRSSADGFNQWHRRMYGDFKEEFFPKRSQIVLEVFKKNKKMQDDFNFPNFDPPEIIEHKNSIEIKTNPKYDTYYTEDGSDPMEANAEINPTAKKIRTGRSFENIKKDYFIHLKARSFSGTHWSGLVEKRIVPRSDTNFEERVESASWRNLSLSVLHFSPNKRYSEIGAVNKEMEFFELKNMSKRTVNIAGISITGGITFDWPRGELGKKLTPSKFLLGPGQSVRIGKNAFVIEERNEVAINKGFKRINSFRILPFSYSKKLGNEGDEFEVRFHKSDLDFNIIDSNGEKIISFEYEPNNSFDFWLASGMGPGLKYLGPTNWSSEKEKSQFLSNLDLWGYYSHKKEGRDGVRKNKTLQVMSINKDQDYNYITVKSSLDNFNYGDVILSQTNDLKSGQWEEVGRVASFKKISNDMVEIVYSVSRDKNRKLNFYRAEFYP